MIAFVEYLTARAWLGTILPELGRRRQTTECYAIEASRPGMALARLTSGLFGIRVAPLSFSILDVRDEEGSWVWLCLLYRDYLPLQREVLHAPLFREAAARVFDVAPRLPLFWAKVIGAATTRFPQRDTLWRAMLVVRVCSWALRQLRAGGPALCFVERRPWDAPLDSYAAAAGLERVSVPATVSVRAWLVERMPARLGIRLRRLRWRWQEARRRRQPSAGAPAVATSPSAQHRIAVEYYGYLNLANPERHSNLFFWQQSRLPAERLLVTFDLPGSLNQQAWSELATHGMSGIALRPSATTLPWKAACAALPGGLPPEGPKLPASRMAEARWLRRQAHAYQEDRAWWTDVVESQRIAIHVSWSRIHERGCAIADAVQAAGGITTIYQRSFETHPSPQIAVAADVVFSSSAMAAEVDRQSGSVIPYCVITGYLGDHRAALWRARAQQVRQGLERHGARRIVAYCDENSFHHAWWAPGHTLTHEAYAFLLERVLAEPSVGLVIKPKTPHTLRRRLGPLAQVLARAEATGRCVVFDEGQVQSAVPPVAAALAADVLVHGHLWAATAGVESALAGVPTLLMDREGWPESPFYRLGVGRVVFTDWPSLWKACVAHWNRPSGIPGFGDWSSMMQELDPFLDGHAAERMGTYLHWLLEGFDAGWDRERVMAAAAERYAEQWGRAMVMSMSPVRPSISLGMPRPPVGAMTEQLVSS